MNSREVGQRALGCFWCYRQGSKGVEDVDMAASIVPSS